MPTAGFCRRCQARVWVSPQGECQFGHPASDLVDVCEVDASTAPVVPRESPIHLWVVWLVVGLVVLSLFVCAAAVTMGYVVSWALRSQTAPSVPAEWTQRAAKDYPGWRVVGFMSYAFDESNDPPETDYVVRVVPPGRDFNIGVTYQSNHGRPPRSDDEILRPGGARHDLAPSLLDYLQRNYVDRDKTVIWVNSTTDGDASVNWEPASSNGDGGTDDLVPSGGTWVPAS